MKPRRLLGALLVCSLASSGIPACSSGGLVGGECRFSLFACGNVCVNLGTDTSHCGQCGRTCDASEVCRSGACLPGPEGSSMADAGIEEAVLPLSVDAGTSGPGLE